MTKQKAPLNIPTLSPQILLNCQTPKIPFALLPTPPHPSYSLALTISPHSLQQNPECSSYIFPGFNLKTKLPKPTTTTKTTAIVFHASDLLNNRSLNPGDRRFYSKHLLDFLFYRDFLAHFFHFSKGKAKSS